jgi:23S rRNA pseudouridine2605 synthase
MPRSRRQTDRDHQAPAAESVERLQKVLARAGLGSRRQCEELITEGRVEIDREVVTELGTRVDPGRHEIRVDGEPLKRSRPQYFALNKPPGVVSTNRDPSGRPRVVDLIASNERLFTVGRLDMSSEGLILVTNDGALANKLAHPRYGVDKTYHVQVAGQPMREDLQSLRKGVHLAEGFVRVKQVRIKQKQKKSTLLEIVLDEGKNREIRRVMARIGHKVLRLKRVAIGPIRLGDLPLGAHRMLTGKELHRLKELAQPRGGTKSVRPGMQRRARRRAAREEAADTGGGKLRGGKKASSKGKSQTDKSPKDTFPSTGAVIDYEAPSGGGQGREASRSGTRKKARSGSFKKKSAGRGGGKSKRKPRR